MTGESDHTELRDQLNGILYNDADVDAVVELVGPLLAAKDAQVRRLQSAVELLGSTLQVAASTARELTAEITAHRKGSAPRGDTTAPSNDGE